VAFLAAFAAVYNNALNLLRPPTMTYVTANTATAAAVLLVGHRMGLDATAMGTSPRQLRSGARWGIAAATCIGGALAVVAGHPRTSRLLDDRRADVATAEFLRWVGLRIPFGTVLLEEVAFRGVLYAALRTRWSPPAATAGSSVLFGVWHLVPALHAVESNAPSAPLRVKVAAAVAGMGATTAAGTVLCDLRQRSGGILAPAVAHLAANTLFAAAAWRRWRPRSSAGRSAGVRRIL
jgi:membrane protease YdiL (CAAX protease family)